VWAACDGGEWGELSSSDSHTSHAHIFIPSIIHRFFFFVYSLPASLTSILPHFFFLPTLPFQFNSTLNQPEQHPVYPITSSSLILHLYRNIPSISNCLRAEFARGDGRIKRKEDERRKRIQPNDTLFVVNFHEITTKREDLQMLFEPFGELIRIDMKRNYAFV
jgi:hypothetical protein